MRGPYQPFSSLSSTFGFEVHTMQRSFKLSTFQVCETNTTTFKDLRLTWTDCDEAEDYVVPNVLSPRDLVFRHDIMDETVTSSSIRIQ